MTINMRPEARRFITMIDTLYNHKVGGKPEPCSQTSPVFTLCSAFMHGSEKFCHSSTSVYYYALWNKVKDSNVKQFVVWKPS